MTPTQKEFTVYVPIQGVAVVTVFAENSTEACKVANSTIDLAAIGQKLEGWDFEVHRDTDFTTEAVGK